VLKHILVLHPPSSPDRANSLLDVLLRLLQGSPRADRLRNFLLERLAIFVDYLLRKLSHLVSPLFGQFIEFLDCLLSALVLVGVRVTLLLDETVYVLLIYLPRQKRSGLLDLSFSAHVIFPSYIKFYHLIIAIFNLVQSKGTLQHGDRPARRRGPGSPFSAPFEKCFVDFSFHRHS